MRSHLQNLNSLAQAEAKFQRINRSVSNYPESCKSGNLPTNCQAWRILILKTDGNIYTLPNIRLFRFQGLDCNISLGSKKLCKSFNFLAKNQTLATVNKNE